MGGAVRGQKAQIGDTRVSSNGYHYTRTEAGWRLTHHLIAEKELGRPLESNESVRFVGDKTDLSPDNITIVLKGKSSLRRRQAQLEARIAELQAELRFINQEIAESE